MREQLRERLTIHLGEDKLRETVDTVVSAIRKANLDFTPTALNDLLELVRYEICSTKN